MKISTLEEHPQLEAEVSRKTEIFLKGIQAVLKGKGFTRTDARLQSAMFHWEFQRGDRKLCITGWHGTGKRGTSRWYGDLKALLSFYDNKAYVDTAMARWKRDEIFKLDVLKGTVEQHHKLLNDTLDYVTGI